MLGVKDALMVVTYTIYSNGSVQISIAHQGVGIYVNIIK